MTPRLAHVDGVPKRRRPAVLLPSAETPAPRRNRLIEMFSDEDYARLLPALEPVRLVRGASIYCAGEQQTHLYFITAGIVIRLYEAAEGDSTGFAVTGREGEIGDVSFLTGKPLLNQTLVVEAGHACRLKVDTVNQELAHGSSLAIALLRHIQATITQMAVDIACTRHHGVEQQLCRWFLECLDRSARHEFTMTQDLLSHILGVRRESVTAAAGHLKSAGVIDYYRGRLVLGDRPGLEARVCGCYKVARQALAMEHVGAAPASTPQRI